LKGPGFEKLTKISNEYFMPHNQERGHHFFFVGHRFTKHILGGSTPTLAI